MTKKKKLVHKATTDSESVYLKRAITMPLLVHVVAMKECMALNTLKDFTIGNIICLQCCAAPPGEVGGSHLPSEPEYRLY